MSDQSFNALSESPREELSHLRSKNVLGLQPLNKASVSYSPRYSFAKEAMQGLSFADKLLFEGFGQGPIVPLAHVCIHHAIEAQAKRSPDMIAAEHAGGNITYGMLERQANRLARHLANQGVKSGDRVGIFLERSIPMLVGILASLKLGAAYVPQHAGVAPQAHLRHIVKVAEIKVILTLSHIKHHVPDIAGKTYILLDEFMQEPFSLDVDYSSFSPDRVLSSDDTCYILFTSGTTGKPNGVQVTHGNVCNILLTEPGNLGMRPGLKVGQILSIAFDMAAWEILACLAHGATLMIRGKNIAETVKQVDVVISTPSILSTLNPQECPQVKVVAVAGEPCPASLAERWSAQARFYNSCGPTETTIVNTMQDYPGHKLSIGKPTPNNTIYILDEDLKPCAIGDVGEMWAGGDCVSAGYLANDALNKDRYRPDPFLGNGRMMFRTRDLGRWTNEGELEHLGRSDDQVKIRGFRVELDSVSALLETTATCKRAVALKLDDRNLVAFVSPLSVDVEEAKEAVAASLPYYCVPSFVQAMEELPMTARGKIDKKVLLAIAGKHTKDSPISKITGAI